MTAWRILPGLLALALSTLFSATGAQAQIAFRSATSGLNEGMGVQHSALGAAGSATGATVTPALPTRVTGDLLLAIIEADDANAVTMPSPNWTQLVTGTQGAVQRASIFWRIATNTAADTATVSHAATPSTRQVLIAQVVAFSNVDLTSPFDGFVLGSSNGTNATVSTGSITTTNACSVRIATVHISDNNTITTPPAVGWYQSFFSTTATGNDAAIGLWYLDATSAGVQPSVSITHSNSGGNDYSHAAQIALRPGGLTLNVPAGTQAGDVMIATLATRPANSTPSNQNAKTVCEPPGWTLVRDTTNDSGGGTGGTGVRLQTYYRVASASEPATYTWYAQLNNPSVPPATVFVSGAGGIASYSGVDTTAPINVEGGNTTANSYSHTGNSITTTVANAMLVSSYTFLSADTWNAPPAGMTERFDQAAPSSPPGNAVGVALGMSDQPRPTAGATGTRTFVAGGTSATDTGIVHMLALRPGVAVHHYAISLLSATVANCDFAEVTITAHNAAHTAVNPPASRTVSLSVSAGAAGAGWGTLQSGSGTWTPSGSTATYTWPGTQSSFTVRLRQSAVISLTVNANDTFVTEGATEDPSISFVNSAFRISNGANAALAIGNQIAAKPSNTGVGTQSLFLQAIRTDTVTGACTSVFPNGSEVDIGVGAQCNNPATCTQNVTLATTSGSGSPSGNFVPAGAGTYPATIRFRFATANAEAPFYFSYADAGQITLQFRYVTAAPAVTIAGTSNAFVTRPFGFAFRGANSGTAIQHGTLPTSSLLAAAGDNFTMTLAAYRWVGAEDDGTGNPLPGANITDNGLTPNFASSTTVSATANLPGAAIGAMSRGVGCAGAASIAAGNWSGGAATLADWCYSEVGNAFVGATATNYIAAGVNVNGNSGLDGTAAAGGYVGRFRPKHFVVTGVPTLTNRAVSACAPASSYTYLNENLRLGFALQARNAQGALTQNYAGAYAKLDLTSAANLGIGARSGGTNLTGRVDAGATPTGSFASGIANIAVLTGIKRASPDNPDGPYPGTQFGIAPSDADGVQMQSYNQDVDGVGGNDHFAVGPGTELRFGRLRLANGYGPDSAGLQLPLDVQYWNGSGFALNTLDDCTSLARANIALAFTGTIGACDTAVVEAAIAFASGASKLTLAAPGAGNTGTVTLTPQLGTAAGTYCPAKGAGIAAATASSADYLLGRWDDASNPDGNANTAYDDQPSGRASFGLYGSQPSNFIYFRENY
jgi:Family of unknown function (DUF6701)